ncbi:hypothetical protein ACHQM5_024220 [Ranunculus cassubicifolius]
MATTAAAVSASAWGKPGGWAQDLEKQEQEESLQQQPLSDFPSLSAAAVTKTKKKKPQTVSLSEFTTGAYKANKGFLTTDVDLSILPTGPRERSADEILGERSGGFKSYSSSSRHSNEEDRWGSSFNNNNNKDRDRGFNREPSRADETDDWGAAKRSMTRDRGGFSSSRGNGSGFFDSQSSKADESDNWLANKKSFVPRSGGGGFESTNGAADSKREEGRPRLVLQPRSLPVTITVNNGDQPPSVTKTNPFGAARPREQVLADKGQDWKKIDEQLESNLKLDVRKTPTERSWRKTDSPAPRRTPVIIVVDNNEIRGGTFPGDSSMTFYCVGHCYHV